VIVDSAAVTLVPVQEPLVLISQVQRSGGTLLSQLFDGHPEVHAHPGELHIGPGKSHWPDISFDETPEQWFDRLFERITLEFVDEGYSKTTAGARDAGTFDVFPFRFDPERQREIFLGEAREAATRRDVLDAYMTSYFNAWLDNANLRTGPKRVLTAFAARLAMNKSDLAAYFGDYAEGTLVTIVREPRAWFDSTRRYQEGHEDVARAMSTWSRSTRSSLRARERYGDRVLIVSFEQLVLETEAMMRSLAQQLGLTFTDELLVPTFNGQPIRADSSRPVYGYGVVHDRAAVPKLESRTEAAILLATDELYARARSVFLEP
jgi:Sulfotransferase family